MSDYKVPYTTILRVENHPNADKLDICTVYGFQVVAQKGRYKSGDNVILIPIDSVIPEWLEARLFNAESKIKLHRRRVRQIRIRKLASQGMLIDPIDVVDKTGTKVKLEQDLQEVLEITKYEPGEPGGPGTPGKPRNKVADNPAFMKYNGLENIKWLPNLFQEGDEVVIQEKLHGTNARAGMMPFAATTFWKKLKKFLRLAPEYEKCYGSNNVEISAQTNYKGYYGEDLYGAAFKNIDVFNKIKPNEAVYGEIVGPNIQKNYEYGLKERKFVLFDVKIRTEDGKQVWLSPAQVETYAKERGFDFVPVLYRGPFNKELAYGLTKGSSMFDPKTKVREGIVIKAGTEYSIEGNKKAVKWLNEVYLDGDQTDFH